MNSAAARPGAPTTALVFGPPGSGVELVADELARAGVLVDGWDGTQPGHAAEDRRELASGRWHFLLRLEAGAESCLERLVESARIGPDDSVTEAITVLATSRRRQRLARIRSRIVIDTTGLSPTMLMARVRELLEVGLLECSGPVVALESFAFSAGLPRDLDWCMDVRALVNPYWVETLRPLSGLDPAVRSFVLEQPLAGTLIDGLDQVVSAQFPLWADHRRPLIRIGVGCTGGFHRSVAVVEECWRRCRERQVRAVRWHRDLTD